MRTGPPPGARRGPRPPSRCGCARFSCLGRVSSQRPASRGVFASPSPSAPPGACCAATPRAAAHAAVTRRPLLPHTCPPLSSSTPPASHPAATRRSVWWPRRAGGARGGDVLAAAAPAAGPPEAAAPPLPLPPGELGLPLLGETLDLLANGDTFGEARLRRHGPLWKTHILGSPTVLVFDEADVRAVLAGEGSLVEAVWPAATKQLVGSQSLNLLRQPRQAEVKGAFARAFGRAAVSQPAVMARMRAIMEAVLGAWADGSVPPEVAGDGGGLRLAQLLASATFHGTVLGMPAGAFEGGDGGGVADAGALLREAAENVAAAEQLAAGFSTLPLPIPGTPFAGALRARAALLDKYAAAVAAAAAAAPSSAAAATLLPGLLAEARAVDATPAELGEGLLSCLFGNASAGPTLTKVLAAAAAGGPLGAQLAEEQAAAAAAAARDSGAPTAAATPVAEAVAVEALRYHPAVPTMFRRALRDFALRGYRIPAGWQVWLYTTDGASKYNRDSFGAQRWLQPPGVESSAGGDVALAPDTAQLQVAPGSSDACPAAAARSTGLPFGSGQRACVGGAFMRAQATALVALLARGYRVTLPDPWERWALLPAPRPAKGLVGLVLERAEMLEGRQ